MMASLVIGYGNTLRGDDAVGRLAAETVEGWRLPDVQTLSVHQLTPELAEDIAIAQRVIFIDAAANASWQLLTPGPSGRSLTHHADPQGLLALAAALYGAMPTAYLLSLPAVHFEVAQFDIRSDNARTGDEPRLPEISPPAPPAPTSSPASPASQLLLSAVARDGLRVGLAQLHAFLTQQAEG